MSLIAQGRNLFPVPRTETGSRVSKGISSGACRASLDSPRTSARGKRSRSQSNTVLGPASPMTAEVSSDGAETHKLQKKQAAQKAPSTDVGGEGRDWCPAGLGEGSQIRHCLGESLSWDKDTPEATSGPSEKGCKGVKPGLLDESLQQQLKSSSSCCLGFTWLSN